MSVCGLKEQLSQCNHQVCCSFDEPALAVTDPELCKGINKAGISWMMAC